MSPGVDAPAQRRLVGALAALSLVVCGCSGGDKVGDSIERETASVSASQAPPADSEPTTVPAVPDLSVPEIQQVLGSGDEALLLDLIGAPEDIDVDPDALSELSAILVLAELNPAGQAFLGEDVATIPATVDGAEWLFYFVLTDGEWKLALTEEIQ